MSSTQAGPSRVTRPRRSPLTPVLIVIALAITLFVVLSNFDAVARAKPTAPDPAALNAKLALLRQQDDQPNTAAVAGAAGSPRVVVTAPVQAAMSALADPKSYPKLETKSLSVPLGINTEFLTSKKLEVAPALQALVTQELNAIFGATPETLKNPGVQDNLTAGARIYTQYCVNCHGQNGNGNGPSAASYLPRPRNFTSGIFKFTTTGYMMKPTRENLQSAVAAGFRDPYKNISMPAFSAVLSPKEIKDVVEYTVALSVRGELESRLLQMAASPEDDSGKTLAEKLGVDLKAETGKLQADWAAAPQNAAEIAAKFGGLVRPSPTLKSVLHGRELFLGKANCLSCHGATAQGTGASFLDRPIFDKIVAEKMTPEKAIETFYEQETSNGRTLPPLADYMASKLQLWKDSVDGWGYPLRPANLLWGYYKGAHGMGDTVATHETAAKAIFLRIAYGVNNAKMQSHFPDPLPTTDDVWDVVNFVMSLPYNPWLLENITITPVGSAPAVAAAPTPTPAAPAAPGAAPVAAPALNVIVTSNAPPRGATASAVSLSTLTIFFGIVSVVGLLWALIQDLTERVQKVTSSVLDLDETQGRADEALTT